MASSDPSAAFQSASTAFLAAEIVLAVALALNVLALIARVTVMITDWRNSRESASWVEYPRSWSRNGIHVDTVSTRVGRGVVTVRCRVSNHRRHGSVSCPGLLVAYQRGVSLPAVRVPREITLLRGATTVQSTRFRLVEDDSPITIAPDWSKAR